MMIMMDDDCIIACGKLGAEQVCPMMSWLCGQKVLSVQASL